MQKPYTKKAEKVLEIAKKASRSMHHSYIGTEHLLIGLLGEGSGAAAKVLSSAGVDEERILELIENLIAPSGNVIVADAGGYSPRTLRVLENAAKEAERFKNEKVGTEHLLIALIKEADCAAVRLLNTLGVNLQRLYVETLTAMGEDVSLHKDEFQNANFPF